MSRFLLFLVMCTLLIGFYNCKTSTHEEEPIKNSKPDQNMFGHGLKRGLTQHKEGVTPGYLMYCVPNSGSTYLISRTGEVVHQWKSNYDVSFLSGYLMADGSIFQNAHDPDFPVFAGGGQCGRIQKISWEGKILWDFEYANEKHHAHHDFAVMPNGNILTIAWESIPSDEVQKAGRKPDQIPKAGLWPDMVVEIKPEGKNGGEVVWEWHIWDHLIQDIDANLAAYGDPFQHPELLDVNLGDKVPPPISEDSMAILHAQDRVWRNETVDNRGSDVFHFNAINYNAELDQIALSSYHLNEIFIIDHSTTTEQAAGHLGGKSGKGGDFLYRWGNPQNYRRGDSTDQVTFHQHDVRWIEVGMPGAGNLTIFNNNIPGGPDSLHYSSVLEITPPMDASGQYILEDGKPYGPNQPTWNYLAPDTISFLSSFISGAHRMANGNTLITEGARGRSFEVTNDGEIVWEYLNPFRGEIRKLNGDPINAMPMTWSLFRSTFIPADHPALAGKVLTPINPQPAVYVAALPPSNPVE